MNVAPLDASSIVRRGAIAVVQRDSRLLVIRRAEGIAAPGAMCFPGGGIEADETEEQAIVRELREELDVAAVPIRRLWENVTGWGVHLAWWLTDVDRDAALTPNPAEVAAVDWYSLDELAQLAGLLDSNREFLAALRSRRIQI